MAAETAEYHTCPICKNKSLRIHCEAVTCNWYVCVTKACDATLDTGLRIGHMNDVNPAPSSAKSKPRIGLILKDGVWRERIYG